MVIAFGAILTFALADGSVAGFDLSIVGIILMLGGALGLLLRLLPLLPRTRPRPGWSTARSRQDAIDDRPPPGPGDSPGYDAGRRRGGRHPGNRRP